MRWIAAAALLFASCAWNGDGEHAATAQRGTVSSDTGTTAVGTLEVEAGVAFDWKDQVDVPAALKWGTTETTELFVGWSPFLWLEVEGDEGEGVGDLALGGRWRFLELTEDHPAAAVQFEALLPVGSNDVSSGEAAYFLAGIVDSAVGRVGLTGFYQFGAIGEEGSSGFDAQHFFAVASGAPLAGALAAYGELVWSEIPELDLQGGFVQTGVYYEANPTLVYDLGVAVGFGPDKTADAALLFGLTKNLGAVGRSEQVPGTELAPGQGP